jgi:hypothetical protein
VRSETDSTPLVPQEAFRLTKQYTEMAESKLRGLLHKKFYAFRPSPEVHEYTQGAIDLLTQYRNTLRHGIPVDANHEARAWKIPRNASQLDSCTTRPYSG